MQQFLVTSIHDIWGAVECCAVFKYIHHGVKRPYEWLLLKPLSDTSPRKGNGNKMPMVEPCCHFGTIGFLRLTKLPWHVLCFFSVSSLGAWKCLI